MGQVRRRGEPVHEPEDDDRESMSADVQGLDSTIEQRYSDSLLLTSLNEALLKVQFVYEETSTHHACYGEIKDARNYLMCAVGEMRSVTEPNTPTP
jgi:hypothetical protein